MSILTLSRRLDRVEAAVASRRERARGRDEFLARLARGRQVWLATLAEKRARGEPYAADDVPELAFDPEDEAQAWGLLGEPERTVEPCEQAFLQRRHVPDLTQGGRGLIDAIEH